MAHTPAQIASLARSHCPTAINTLARIMTAPQASHMAQIAAAKAICEIGGVKEITLHIQGEVAHRYVIEVPRELTRDEWIQKHSPPMIESNPAT